MTQWMVKLAGHEFDLRALSNLYKEPACRVAKDGDGAYYLTRNTFEAMATGEEAHTAAHEVISVVNRLMLLRNPDYQPVSVDSVVRVNNDGTRSYYVFGSAVMAGHGGASLEATVIGPDGQPVPSPEPAIAQARLNLIERDERAREALDYSERCVLGDVDCYSYAYKISEIVLEDMGSGDIAKGAQAVCGAGWATADEMRDFTATVHLRAFGGRKARHAGAGQAQAKALARQLNAGAKKLSESEVIACIKRVLRGWLDWKAARTP